MAQPKSSGAGAGGARSGRSRQRGAHQLAELANGVIDPVLARRAGISTALLSSWPDIAGPDFSDCTRPEKIVWPRQSHEDSRGGGHQPGVLTIACEGARALFLTHAQGELISRINGFFGFPAIRQIRIVQKPVAPDTSGRRKPAPLKGEAARRLSGMVEGIEGERLRAALERLGTVVFSKTRSR